MVLTKGNSIGYSQIYAYLHVQLLKDFEFNLLILITDIHLQTILSVLTHLF